MKTLIFVIVSVFFLNIQADDVNVEMKCTGKTNKELKLRIYDFKISDDTNIANLKIDVKHQFVKTRVYTTSVNLNEIGESTVEAFVGTNSKSRVNGSSIKKAIVFTASKDNKSGLLAENSNVYHLDCVNLSRK